MLGRLKKRTRKYRRSLAGVSVLSAVKLVNWMSPEIAERFARGLGVGMYWFSRTDRKRIHDHLHLVFASEKSDEEIVTLSKRVCINLARAAVEAIRLRKASRSEIEHRINDHDFGRIIEDVFNRGRSMMIITAHYGNWELFAARMAQLGKLTVLARKNTNPRIEQVIEDTRRLNHVRVLDRSDVSAPREMIRMGREGGHILGILMDQDTARIQGLFSPFMGIPALTPSGPASIAIRDLFDVYAAVLKPLEDGQHEFVYEGPLEIPTEGNRESRIQAVTDMFNDCLSRMILEAPEFWVWNHRRWRHKPVQQPVEEGE